eukprot:1195834-Prorocentrum_minimum.AAC.5
MAMAIAPRAWLGWRRWACVSVDQRGFNTSSLVGVRVGGPARVQHVQQTSGRGGLPHRPPGGSQGGIEGGPRAPPEFAPLAPPKHAPVLGTAPAQRYS